MSTPTPPGDNPDNSNQPGETPHEPGQYGQQPGQPGQYPQQPGQYGGQPGQYPQQPGQPGQYGQQPGQYGGQEPYGSDPGQSGSYPGQPSGYPSQPGAYGYDAPAAPPNKTPMILSVIGIVCWFCCSPASIVLGLFAQSKFRERGQSDTLAKVAWIGGIAFLVLGIVSYATGLYRPGG